MSALSPGASVRSVTPSLPPSMKILCNIHPLGKSAHGTVARTGVFRVVEHLIRGLAATEEETFFHPLDHLWQSWHYYEEHLRGPRTHFLLAPARRALARHRSPMERFVATTLQNRAPYMRLLRFASVHYGIVADRLLKGELDERTLGEMDIYHSPFMPIPAQVKRHRRVRRFTTVYDLIAVTHPDLFGGGTINVIRSLVDGLDEEDHAICISEATREVLLTHVPQAGPGTGFRRAARGRTGLPPRTRRSEGRRRARACGAAAGRAVPIEPLHPGTPQKSRRGDPRLRLAAP